MLAMKEFLSTNDTGQTYKVINIFAKKGTNILKKKKICEVQSDNGNRIIIKAQHNGVVARVLVKVNDMVEDGSEIMEITACAHPAMMGNICCDCGMVLEEMDLKTSDTVSMLHSVPDLKIAKEEAEKLGKEDITNLLGQKKLVLLVDLDQTLIHTTNDNIPPKLKDVYHFQLHTAGPWYHTRLRPHTKEFLERLSKLYELHICTFGVREYAHYIAHFLDPEGKLFGQRILSRNECLDPMSKKANLNSLFPCGDNLVCIIDDRTDVWNFSPNVVQVVPYHFFRHTGDINAPQGLQKRENDDRQGIDFKSFGKDSSNDTPEASDEESDKKSYSSDSESDKDSRGKQDLVVESLDSGKVSDDSAVDVNTEDGKSDSSDVCDIQSAKTLLKDDDFPSEEKDNDNEAIVEKAKEMRVEVASIEKDPGNVPESGEIVDERTDAKSSEETKEKPSDERKPKELNKDSNSDNKGSEIEKEKNEEKRTDMIEVEDDDDFLLYLEDILIKIHRTFFIQYDAMKPQSDSRENLPDLKRLVPQVRRDVLKGTHLVFSGVVPQQVQMKDSKAYQIATCFGASVSDRLVIKAKGDGDRGKLNYTTHLVAANVNTEKVHRARRCKSIKIVTPNWLWTCVERWELVEERLFTLTKDTEKTVQRHPPHHCYCPDLPHHHTSQNEGVPGPSGRTRTPSGNLLQDMNPLLFFSPDDKNSMAVEVDMMLSDEDESNDEKDTSEEEDEDCGPERKKPRSFDERDLDSSSSSNKQSDEEGDDDLPSTIFRQGGGLPSDDSNDGLSDEDDLSRMGADLESLLD